MPERGAEGITPDSRIGELLERWPQLEEVLVGLSPHFQALRNPVLRRTVAKVATLRQVSAVGGVPLGILIERLRAGAGLPPIAVAEDGPGPAASRPAWAVETAVVRTLDARADIETGKHPMPQVLAELARLREGDVLQLLTPFVPAPLLDMARARGYESHTVAEADDLVRTFFRRGGSPAPA